MIILYFFAKLVAITLDVISIAMIARMLLPLFTSPEDSRIYMFLVFITEPFVIPVRFFLSKISAIQNSPFDWSFTAAYMIIVFLRLVLPVV